MSWTFGTLLTFEIEKAGFFVGRKNGEFGGNSRNMHDLFLKENAMRS